MGPGTEGDLGIPRLGHGERDRGDLGIPRLGHGERDRRGPPQVPLLGSLDIFPWKISAGLCPSNSVSSVAQR